MPATPSRTAPQRRRSGAPIIDPYFASSEDGNLATPTTKTDAKSCFTEVREHFGITPEGTL